MSEQEINPEPSNETTELSHSDLLTGVFVSPAETLKQYSKQPIRTLDYVLPLLVLIVVIIVSSNVIFSNPSIAYQMKAKQKEAIKKQLEDQVKKGTLSRAEADERIAKSEDQLKIMDSTAGKLLGAAGILLSTVIMILIVCGFYLLLLRFVFSHDISYKQIITASALSGYISIISVTLNTVAAMLLDKMTTGISPLLFIHADPGTVMYFLLSKLDPLTIWGYFVFAVALASFAKKEIGQYVLIVFGTYLCWSALAFFVLSKLPFFGGLAGS